MVEQARTMERMIDVPQWKAGGSDGLPSPTSPLERTAAPSPRGWRHRDAVGGVGLGILAALEAQPAASARVSAPISIARRAARLEVSELGCSGRCATSLCGGGPASTPANPGASFRVAEFLSCCDMCRRPLDGKDIFMYRGERAFCSMECRYHAIVCDEFQEEKERNRRAGASSSEAPRKAAAEMAGSPCNGGGQIFFTGIVAA
ncbi:FCS-Like Zinc finger 13-like [Phragmites australis]|uniref:FCS-Like Zinc finger 13-like n=1 Tax=Phragmites australis TaxID=29695 RepID=UPI002D786DA2|nr:FCS-Like Zinc finger 13-like [Phragmites australis]